MIKKMFFLLLITFSINCIFLNAQSPDDLTVKTEILIDSLSNKSYGEITITIPEYAETGEYSYYLFAEQFLGELIDSQSTSNKTITFKVSDISRDYVISVKNYDASFQKVQHIKIK
jgi:hypothetical protein